MFILESKQQNKRLFPQFNYFSDPTEIEDVRWPVSHGRIECRAANHKIIP